MIRYLSHSGIDKTEWDRCIATSPQGEVYAFSWFLDIVSPGWEALVKGNYESVFPLTKRKKYGMDYLYQPYFTQQLGLFSSSTELTEDEIQTFLSAIPAKFRLVEIQLNAGNHNASSNDFVFSPRKTHLLDLSPAYENLRSSYSENLKRNLKKADVLETVLHESGSVKEVVSLFKINRGRTVDNLNDDDYEVFVRLMEEAGKRNLVEVLYTKDREDNITAGAIFLKSVSSYIFIFSATSDEGRRTGAMSRIIDGFIKKHSGEKKRLDFEGSMDENLARYYKSFGSKEVVYLQIRKNKLPLLIRWLK